MFILDPIHLITQKDHNLLLFLLMAFQLKSVNGLFLYFDFKSLLSLSIIKVKKLQNCIVIILFNLIVDKN